MDYRKLNGKFKKDQISNRYNSAILHPITKILTDLESARHVDDF